MELQSVNEIIKKLSKDDLMKLKSNVSEVNVDELAIMTGVEKGLDPDEVAELLSEKEENINKIVDILNKAIEHIPLNERFRLKEEITKMKAENRVEFIKKIRDIEIN